MKGEEVKISVERGTIVWCNNKEDTKKISGLFVIFFPKWQLSPKRLKDLKTSSFFQTEQMTSVLILTEVRKKKKMLTEHVC